jgi:hypothetical protein
MNESKKLKPRSSSEKREAKASLFFGREIEIIWTSSNTISKGKKQ